MSAEAVFEVIPAIDLLDGQCVRLSQGRYDEATVYASDPGALASSFAELAIRRLHVVDLDGAREGSPRNSEAIAQIVSAAGSVPVQLGGGLRDLASLENALAWGLDRVILGTVALRDPALVREAAKRFPGRVAVGIDAREGNVAVEGWVESSEVPALDLARRFEDVGVVALIYTDIARDGMLTGPALESTAKLAEAVEIPVIASGGVGSEDDVVEAAALAPRGVSGVIVGRALYTGAVELKSVLARIAC